MSAAAPARLVLATQNRGKARELESFLRGLVRVESLADHPELRLPPEDGQTFLENARLKAEYVSSALGLPALGDDSGLAVDALGGAPGVRSARYAEGSDRDRYLKLLGALVGLEADRRGARFVCGLAFAAPGEPTVLTEGFVAGRIGVAPRGEGGFGYDPVFLPDAAPGRTMAELSVEEKQALSHRGEALRRMEPRLLEYFSLAGRAGSP